MRILLAHKFFRIIGGDAVFFHETGRILRERGHEVAYFSTMNEHEAYDKNYSYPDENLFFGKAVNYTNSGIVSKIFKLPSLIHSNENKRLMKEAIRKFKPDLIHCFAIFTTLTPSIMEAAREEGIPVLLLQQDYKMICPNYKLFHHGHLCEDCKGGKFYNAILNKCCQDSTAFSVASAIESYVQQWKNMVRKNVDLLIFSSRFMADKTTEFWKEKMLPFEILHNPFNSPSFSVSTITNNYFVFTGRLVPEKGVDILLQAMNQVKTSAKLLIVGDGIMKDELQMQTEKLGLTNIEFAGAKWGDELKKIVSESRFVVVPSIWHENFPFVVCEAFAQGKAVIGSNRGGIPELICDGEYGFTYEGDDSTVLAKHIDFLWNNLEKAKEMGAAAKKFADEKFNEDVFYTELMKIYSGALSSNASKKKLAV